MRKFLIIILSIILLPVAYHLGKRLYFGSHWASSRCDKIEIESVDSPDHRWEAKAVLIACGDGFASSEGVAVIVVKPGTWWPTVRDEVLQLSLGWEDGATLEWQSPSRLLISVPESMEIFKHRPVVGSVTSEIKMVPIDLAARERYFCAPDREYSYSCREAREQSQKKLNEPVTER